MVIAKISVTSRAQLQLKTKEMTENSRTSNDCRFTFMLDLILKPGGKLEYHDNASLLKFKELRVPTPAENRVGNSSGSKGFDQFERASASHTHQ